MFSFFVVGLVNASLGVILSPLSHEYALSDTQVSTLFLVGPLGYIFAAQSNSFLNSRYGHFGIASIAPAMHFFGSLVIASRPTSFAVLLAGVGCMYVGTGLLDGSWCSWAAVMPSANRVSGFLHGSFSAGAAIGPFLASTIMTTMRRSWYTWYWLLACVASLEWIILCFAFRIQTTTKSHTQDSTSRQSAAMTDKSMLSYPALYLVAIYFLVDVGVETAISGWIVTFMMRARNTSPRLASFSSSGFWAGQALGRLLLGSVTDKLGVRLANVVYLIIVVITQTLFAVNQNVPVAVALASVFGFFMGPMFPSGVIVLTQLLPSRMHIAAVSLVASIGQVGSAILPFGIGAVVDQLGIEVFETAIPAGMTLVLGFWILLSRLRFRDIVSDRRDGTII